MKDIPSAMTIPEARASREPATIPAVGMCGPDCPDRQSQGGRREQRIRSIGDGLKQVGTWGQRPERSRSPRSGGRQCGSRQQVERHDGAGAGEERQECGGVEGSLALRAKGVGASGLAKTRKPASTEAGM